MSKMPKKSSKSKKPTVSFVIRTKNEAKFIGKVLRSLETQTYKNIEIIVVDSGSTDKTLEIIKNFPIKLIQIKPEEFNHSYALNLGIKETQGEFICIISGHSLPLSNTWLEDGLINFKDPKVAGISGHYTEFPTGYYSRKLGKLILKLARGKRATFSPWMTNTNSIIRKDLWKEYPFDEKLPECEDYDWACEMLARGYNIIKNPKFSVFHSHFLLGKPGYWRRLSKWKKICAMIDKRKRPRKSFTRLKI